jgi:hypothetical protein
MAIVTCNTCNHQAEVIRSGPDELRIVQFDGPDFLSRCVQQTAENLIDPGGCWRFRQSILATRRSRAP